MLPPNDDALIRKSHLSIRASSTAFTTSQGAGSRSTVTATSASGKISSSHEEVFTPGATSSRSSASACISLSEVTTNAVAEAPASQQQSDRSRPDFKG